MARFMVLYRSSAAAGEQMANADPEQMQAGMALWMKWAEKAGPAIVDFGQPLGNGRTLPGGGDASDGYPIGGYSILEADSLDAVTNLLDGHPHFHSPDASIEVLELLPVPGMG